jgi:hypothetical protein
MTLKFYTNVTGQFKPPLFIFPREKIKQTILSNGPAEAVAVVQSNGWMNSDILLFRLKEFVRHVLPSADNSILLITDGYSNHKDL